MNARPMVTRMSSAGGEDELAAVACLSEDDYLMTGANVLAFEREIGELLETDRKVVG